MRFESDVVHMFAYSNALRYHQSSLLAKWLIVRGLLRILFVCNTQMGKIYHQKLAIFSFFIIESVV